jgi:RNA polymerase sigma-70 factor (family 1)
MVDHNSLTDPELVALLKQRDGGAFTELYNRYWKLIYAHVYKMLRDPDDSSDIIQEIFGNLWLKSAEIKNDLNIAGFLYVAARSKVFDLIEKNKVRSDYLTEIGNYMDNVSSHQVETIDEKRILQILDREIQLLPSKMREIFELSRKSNLSHREISEKLNISEQTVKKQVQNALKIIKPKLNSIGIGISALILLR